MSHKHAAPNARRDEPEEVRRALELTRALGFTKSCLPEVGRLLRLLVTQARAGTVGEIGTGSGVGSAWMLSGLRPDQRFVSIDNQPSLHTAVTELFGEQPGATFMMGDWRDILSYAPFTLVFVDASDAKDAGAQEVVDALAPGGLAVLDGREVVEHWPPEWHGKPDTRRDFWLNHPALHALEVRTSASASVILASKIS
jgi:predicted O-methyltransferase YrrM